jgi:hypothetical protein
MDSMILPQVHLTYPAEGLDLGHAELAPCSIINNPSELSGPNPSSQDYFVGPTIS